MMDLISSNLLSLNNASSIIGLLSYIYPKLRDIGGLTKAYDESFLESWFLSLLLSYFISSFIKTISYYLKKNSNDTLFNSVILEALDWVLLILNIFYYPTLSPNYSAYMNKFLPNFLLNFGSFLKIYGFLYKIALFVAWLLFLAICVIYEPAFFFFEILDNLGQFTAKAEAMQSPVSMGFTLLSCIGLAIFSFYTIYLSTLSTLYYTFPAGISIVIWLLMLASFSLTVYKLFIPNDDNSLNQPWTITQIAFVLFYQISTISSINTILCLENTSYSLSIVNKVLSLMRMLFHWVVVFVVFYRFGLAYIPELFPGFETLVSNVYNQDGQTQENRTINYRSIIPKVIRAGVELTFLFFKPIVLLISYIYFKRNYSTTPMINLDITIYPFKLLEVGLVINVVIITTMNLYLLFVKDLDQDLKDLEQDEILSIINAANGL
ncbi:hypothetical protein K502DRAFT_349666 [Neoconidiobolus thromboides FSU 785]|nr:hypothetical protein K502DRAFT_349666 [Neoconidiobolus thromboides FSU 785]